MKPGDRVIITARSHPWFDEIGRIEAGAEPKMQRLRLNWIVKLETGMPGQQVYVGSDEIKALA